MPDWNTEQMFGFFLPKMHQLTQRQQEILEFLREQIAERGVVPSVREIMERFGFSSTATVHEHLRLLERKGVLRRKAGLARNIRLEASVVRGDAPRAADAADATNPADGTDFVLPGLRRIPVLGAIPAGMPDTTGEMQSDRCIAVDMDSIELPRSARTFALEVRGDSMVGAGIFDRDIVIMELAEPRHRDIVAALIDGETTLKRFLVQRGRPFLRAENPKYPDLIPAQELVIQGVLRALIRIHRGR